MNQLPVYKNRTNKVQVALGFDVSLDTFKSEIRDGSSEDSNLILEWEVSFATDGVDGELILTIDESAFDDLEFTGSVGYMDMKRITGGESLPVFDDVLEVLFKDTITV